MSGRVARTHHDAGTLQLLADRAPMNAQFVTDLAQGPALRVQVGCPVDVHRDTVTCLIRIMSCLGPRVSRGQFWSAIGTPNHVSMRNIRASASQRR